MSLIFSPLINQKTEDKTKPYSSGSASHLNKEASAHNPTNHFLIGFPEFGGGDFVWPPLRTNRSGGGGGGGGGGDFCSVIVLHFFGGCGFTTSTPSRINLGGGGGGGDGGGACVEGAGFDGAGGFVFI